jgi:hypothetical protein
MCHSAPTSFVAASITASKEGVVQDRITAKAPEHLRRGFLFVDGS